MTVRRWFVGPAVAVASAAAGAAADPPRRGDATATVRASRARMAPPRADMVAAPRAVAAPATATVVFRDDLAADIPRVDSAGPALVLDALELRLDVRARRAHLRLRGDTPLVSFQLASDIVVRGGAAAFDAHLQIAAGGHRFELALPDIELAPRSYLGERYLEVRVPFVRRRF